MRKGALDGVVLLDLTQILTGPYCSMLLADIVVKIEKPGVGDGSRAHYPNVKGESAYCMNPNRNKWGVTLNLKAPEGKELFRKINPKIIVGCVSGFGHYGPCKERPDYDIVGQAAA